jgi:DNA-binding transcriptional LysR family regulator
LAVNSFQVLAALTAAGAGIARLPVFAARPWLTAKRIQEVLAAWALPATGPFAVYPSAKQVSPAVRAMVEVLTECFEEQPWSAAPAGVR